eukprot:Pgem_evm1s17803
MSCENKIRQCLDYFSVNAQYSAPDLGLMCEAAKRYQQCQQKLIPECGLNYINDIITNTSQRHINNFCTPNVTTINVNNNNGNINNDNGFNTWLIVCLAIGGSFVLLNLLFLGGAIKKNSYIELCDDKNLKVAKNELVHV